MVSFAVDGTPWGAPEWMPFTLIKTPPQGGHGTPARWDFAFEDILSYRNNRLVVMQVKQRNATFGAIYK